MAFNPNGIFYTSFNPDELNKKSFAAAILRLYPNGSAPLFAMTGQVGKSKALAASHGYFTKSMVFGAVTTTAIVLAAATNFPVISTGGIVADMVLQTASRENVLVTAVVDATNLTVVRSHGRVAAADLADAEVVIAVGNSHTQSSTRPTARTIESVYVPNFTQIIRNAWAISDTARASYAEAGFDNISESREDCMQLHSTDIESTLFWGQASSPAGSPPRSATQGLIDAVYEHAPANVTTAGGTTTYSQLVDLVESCFSEQTSMGNAKERVAFCDSQAMKVLHDIGRASGQVTMEQKETSFGMMFTDFKIYKGKIRLLEHPLFNGLPIDGGFMAIVDLPSMALAYMEGRDVKKESYNGSKDGVEGGIDAQGGSLTTEFATEFKNPGSCQIVNGLTASA